MKIRVPASSANIGPGFDSMGIAVSLYLEVEVLGASSHWQIDHDLGDLPHDENNMIAATARTVAPGIAPQHLKVTTRIPVTHGLGSSSSAIVAGIELADQLQQLGLSKEEKVEIASKMEGHPDNVAPAILGGLVVGTQVKGRFSAIEAPLLPYAMVAYIPAYNLRTSDARAALPKELSYKQATHASAIANTLVAALFSKDYEVAGRMMEADLFHEQYREPLVPELTQIRGIGHRTGALATFLSGAGPTVMTIVPQDKVDGFVSALREAGLSDRVERLQPDIQGAVVIK